MTLSNVSSVAEKMGVRIESENENEKRTGAMFCLLKKHEIDVLSESVDFIFQLQNGVLDRGNVLWRKGKKMIRVHDMKAKEYLFSQ